MGECSVLAGRAATQGQLSHACGSLCQRSKGHMPDGRGNPIGEADPGRPKNSALLFQRFFFFGKYFCISLCLSFPSWPPRAAAARAVCTGLPRRPLQSLSLEWCTATPVGSSGHASSLFRQGPGSPGTQKTGCSFILHKGMPEEVVPGLSEMQGHLGWLWLVSPWPHVAEPAGGSARDGCVPGAVWPRTLAQSRSGDLEITVGGPIMWGPTLPWTRSQPVRSACGSRGASGAS